MKRDEVETSGDNFSDAFVTAEHLDSQKGPVPQSSLPALTLTILDVVTEVVGEVGFGPLAYAFSTCWPRRGTRAHPNVIEPTSGDFLYFGSTAPSSPRSF